MVRISVMTMPDSPWTAYLQARIPHLEVVTDTTQNALDTFLTQLASFGRGPAVHLEDDIILTRGFLVKLQQGIAQHPDRMVNFFSRRKDDRTLGSRWNRYYMMSQCVYFPPGYAAAMLAFATGGWRAQREAGWTADDFAKTRGGIDTLIGAWLDARKEAYWIHVPSLVQHRIAKSRLGPRSSKRQSLTFVDPDGE